MKDKDKSKKELIAVIQRLERENQDLSKALSKNVESQKNTGSKTILVVDDNEDTRTVVAAMLEDLNYKIIQAGSSSQALDIFAAQRHLIDLVLTDIVMPDGGGPEMMNKITQLKSDTKMVFMSGYAEDEIVHDDVFKIQHSNSAFIKKPFSQKEIESIIRLQLER